MASLSAALLAGELGTECALVRAGGDEAEAEDEAEASAGDLVRSMASTSLKVSLPFLLFFFLDLGVFILRIG